ncbi:MAG: hypothetical protein H7338_07150 [Candidatus Sericytochromatia bacterium]|nr:hypothetical protein [Candidatus Sericytochromatia bacterium]
MLQTVTAPALVRLTRHQMVPGVPAWPQRDTTTARRGMAKAVLEQALVDVLGYDDVSRDVSGGSAAESVATALLQALGAARWSLRNGTGGGEVLGRF